jgi:hypothetical protein
MPFGDPPLLPGMSHSGSPSAMLPMPQASLSGGTTAHAGPMPQKIENVAAGKPLTADAYGPKAESGAAAPTSDQPSGPLTSSKQNSASTQPSVMSHPLDANRMPAWMLDQLKQPSHTETAPRTGAASAPQVGAAVAPQTSAAAKPATESNEPFRYEN